MRQACSVNFDSATSFNKNREELSVSPAKSHANLGIGSYCRQMVFVSK